MDKTEFWRLQKAANLSNREAADYLDVSLRSIVKWRVNESKPPKAVILALTAYVEKMNE